MQMMCCRDSQSKQQGWSLPPQATHWLPLQRVPVAVQNEVLLATQQAWLRLPHLPSLQAPFKQREPWAHESPFLRQTPRTQQPP